MGRLVFAAYGPIGGAFLKLHSLPADELLGYGPWVWAEDRINRVHALPRNQDEEETCAPT